MRREGWIGLVGVVLAAVGLSGALVVTQGPAVDERPTVEVLGQVEEAPVPPAPPAAAVVVTTPAPTTAPPASTVATTTVPDTSTAPAPAEAPSAPVPPAPTPEDRARQAIAEIGYPWQERFPTWTVEIGAARSGVRALTYPDQRRVELFPRRDDTVDELRRILAHELGHVADLELNDAADRQRWRDARGVGAGVPWWPDGTSFDFDTLAGDFAEGFAAWLEGSATQSRVGGPLTPDQLGLMGELVA